MPRPVKHIKPRDVKRATQAGILIGMEKSRKEALPAVIATIPNIAHAFKVSTRTVRNWARCGMPYSHNGQGQIVIVVPIVEAWLLRWKKNRENPKSIPSVPIEDQVKMVLGI